MIIDIEFTSSEIEGLGLCVRVDFAKPEQAIDDPGSWALAPRWRVSLELQFQGELARAGTTNSIERIEASVIFVLCRSDLTKTRSGNEVINHVCWWGREHRVIEQVEILDAEKQREAIGQGKSATDGQVRLGRWETAEIVAGPARALAAGRMGS